jgi:hypothetical protein
MLASFTQSAGEPWTPKPVNRSPTSTLVQASGSANVMLWLAPDQLLRRGHDRYLAELDELFVQGRQARGEDAIVICQQYPHRYVDPNPHPRSAGHQTIRLSMKDVVGRTPPIIVITLPAAL